MRTDAQSLEEIIGVNAARVRRAFEIPVLLAALAVVPVIYIEETATRPWALSAASIANWLIWGAFAAEYGVVMLVTNQRWAYTKKAWLDVLIIVVSFPVLPALLASSRLLRLARLARVLRMLRLVRLAAILSRGGRAAGIIFGRRGLGYIVVLTILMAMGVGGVFAIIEGVDIVDGFWWSIVTLTTVGYGTSSLSRSLAELRRLY